MNWTIYGLIGVSLAEIPSTNGTKLTPIKAFVSKVGRGPVLVTKHRLPFKGSIIFPVTFSCLTKPRGSEFVIAVTMILS